MDDLVAFLRARLDEDEAYLRELTAIGERKRDTATTADFAANMPVIWELLADPAVRRIMQRQEALRYPPPNDVPRLLREIEAKRAILDAHPAITYERFPDWPSRCRTCITDRGPYREDWEFDTFPCQTVHALAAVYSDHPGYRDEWKP